MLSKSKKRKRTDKEVSLGKDEISEASFDGARPVHPQTEQSARNKSTFNEWRSETRSIKSVYSSIPYSKGLFVSVEKVKEVFIKHFTLILLFNIAIC